MIDLLAAPIRELAGSFGTGMCPAGGPPDALRAASDGLASAARIGNAVVGAIEPVWSGVAAVAAQAAVREAALAAVALQEHGDELNALLARATASVQAGSAELAGILDSFLAFAAAAAPTLATPAGQAALVAVAAEHLGRAMAVVARVRAELAEHTARASALAAPPTMPDRADAWPAFANAASTLPASFSGFTGAATPPSEGAAPGHRAYDPGTGGTGVTVTLPDGSTATAPNEKAASAVQFALAQQGTPYVWGGTTPGQGLDCSGLTQSAYGQAGVDIPRLAADQDIGTPVAAENLLPGDLAVWDGHVAMVVGNGQLVEAGDPVQVNPIRTSNSGMAFHGFYRPTA